MKAFCASHVCLVLGLLQVGAFVLGESTGRPQGHHARGLLTDNKCKNFGASKVYAQYENDTFLESIVVKPDGTLFLSSLWDGQVYRLSSSGKRSIFATVGNRVNGLAESPDGKGLIVVGANFKDQPAVWKISSKGKVSEVGTIPSALLLNGLTPLSGSEYLIADSRASAIFKVDVYTGKISTWVKDPLLAPNTSQGIAADGLKIFGGYVYTSSLDLKAILRIPILGRKRVAGKVEVYASNVVVDDFAFDIKGNIYGAGFDTNKLIKIDRKKVVTTIATQGLQGASAVAFGRSGDFKEKVFITTNGGRIGPPAADGRVVVVKVCAVGAAI